MVLIATMEISTSVSIAIAGKVKYWHNIKTIHTLAVSGNSRSRTFVALVNLCELVDGVHTYIRTRKGSPDLFRRRQDSTLIIVFDRKYQLRRHRRAHVSRVVEDGVRRLSVPMGRSEIRSFYINTSTRYNLLLKNHKYRVFLQIRSLYVQITRSFVSIRTIYEYKRVPGTWYNFSLG